MRTEGMGFPAETSTNWKPAFVINRQLNQLYECFSSVKFCALYLRKINDSGLRRLPRLAKPKKWRVRVKKHGQHAKFRPSPHVRQLRSVCDVISARFRHLSCWGYPKKCREEALMSIMLTLLESGGDFKFIHGWVGKMASRMALELFRMIISLKRDSHVFIPPHPADDSVRVK